MRHQGFVSPASLLHALYDGTLLSDEPGATAVLEAIVSLTKPDPKLWNCPLVRAVLPPQR